MSKLIWIVAALLALAIPTAAGAARNDDATGAVYAITNATTGNGVAYYTRTHDGTLRLVATYASGGVGTGAGLGSQGAVVLDHDLLFAVNAGSNSVSEFAVREDGLKLLRVFDSNGVRPISIAVHRNLLYVLNGGSSAITGFRIEGKGRVQAIDGSTQPLLGSGPAQVAFSSDGDELVVTEKTSSTIDTFPIGRGGRALAGVTGPSAGATPFGFAFDDRGHAFVSEASGSASSYSVDASGAHVISPAVLTNQAAPCWLVVTPNGRFAYTANAGGASISGFAIARDGGISLASTTLLGAGAHPLDEGVSSDGRFLYVLVDGRHTVGAFRIGSDGSLTPLGEAGILPAGAVGLAAS
jgi:6-phosphogluconolactonase (cycloisomerase 2 family)